MGSADRARMKRIPADASDGTQDEALHSDVPGDSMIA
jgi:hypothetical protein